jgi:hypothetical protein
MKIGSVKFAWIVVACFLTFAMRPVTAHAQGTSQQRSACMGDAFRLCIADIPNVAQIEACLSQNRNSLTRACAAEFSPQGKTKLRPEHFR